MRIQCDKKKTTENITVTERDKEKYVRYAKIYNNEKERKCLCCYVVRVDSVPTQ